MTQTSTFSLKDNFEVVKGFRFPNLQAWTEGSLRSGNRVDGAGRYIADVGDLNNDGLDDLLVVYMDVIVKKPLILISNGDGTFREETRILGEAEQRSAREAQIVDVNSDGFNDIVYFPASHGWKEEILGPRWNAFDPVLLLINDGGNGFTVNQSMLSLPEGYFHSGDTGYLNFDHLLDIFPVSEYTPEGTGIGRGLPRVARTQNTDGTFSLENKPSPEPIRDYQVNNVAIGDINNDGFTDYAFTVFPQSSPKLDLDSPTIAFAFGDDSWDIDSYRWSFIGESPISFSDIQDLERLSGRKIEETFPQIVHFVDLDNDGLEEIFIGYTVDQGHSIFQILKLTDGSFLDVTSQLFPSLYSNRYNKGFPGPLYRVDLNNDGVKDLVYSVKVEEDPYKLGLPNSSSLFINESGTYLPVALGSYPGLESLQLKYFEGFVSGDFNGDGFDDLAAVSSDVSSSDDYNFVTVLLNKGISSTDGVQADVESVKRFTQLPGNQIFDGRKFDFSVLTTNTTESEVSLLRLSKDSWRLSTSSNGSREQDVDYLISVDRIVLRDSAIAIDVDGSTSAGGIYRLYKATFNREPDAGGLGYWIAQADAGNKDAVRMAEDFVWSEEFQDLYNITTTDNYGTGTNIQSLVTGFYENVLGRTPDQGGLDFYTGVIESKERTVGRVLAEISDSQENYDGTIELIANGIVFDPYVG